MKYLKIFFIVISINFFALSAIASSPNLKDAFKPENSALQQVADGAGYNRDVEEAGLNSVISILIKTLLSILGVLFMLLMIYGGFLWMTDQGNTTQVDKAKKLITAAIVGLLIVLLSYSISVFVFEKISVQVLTE